MHLIAPKGKNTHFNCWKHQFNDFKKVFANSEIYKFRKKIENKMKIIIVVIISFEKTKTNNKLQLTAGKAGYHKITMY